MTCAANIDDWFTYHPPSVETAEKHKAISRAYGKLEQACRFAYLSEDNPTLKLFVKQFPDDNSPATHNAFELVNDVCKDTALELDTLAPDCAEKDISLYGLRSTRMWMNLAIRTAHEERRAAEEGAVRQHGESAEFYWREARRELHLSKMWANAAIAISAAKVARVIEEAKT